MSDVKPTTTEHTRKANKLIVSTTVSIQPVIVNNNSNESIEDIAKEAVNETSNTCVLKTDVQIDAHMKKLIKQ
jgi:DNA-binding protein YbaB